LPKQYAPLLGIPLIEWTLRSLLAEPRIAAVVVVLAPGDTYTGLPLAERLASRRVLTATGGCDAPGFRTQRPAGRWRRTPRPMTGSSCMMPRVHA
jgi:hypothetical protein